MCLKKEGDICYRHGDVYGYTLHTSSNLGEAISIDEFKGNVGTEKYQTIVVNPVKHRVFDVFYSIKGTCLVDYFKSLDPSKHMKVQYFSCDMNKTFIDLARIYFLNAKIVIDRYHFVRQVYWALENVRKRIQSGAKISLNKTDIGYSINLLEKTMQFLQKEWVENHPTPAFDKELVLFTFKILMTFEIFTLS